MMNEAFLEILPAKFTIADFEKYKLPLPVRTVKDNFKFVFITENEYCQYLNGLQDECNNDLLQYSVIKNPDLFSKSRFIVKVLAFLTSARPKINFN